MSNEITEQQVEELAARNKAKASRFVEEVMSEIFSRMPFGQTFEIVSAGTPVHATIKPLTGVTWRSEKNPYRTSLVSDTYADMRAAEYDHKHGRPQFTMDVVWEGGLIEITVKQTGWEAKL